MFGHVDKSNVSVLNCPTSVSDVVIVLEKVIFFWFGTLPGITLVVSGVSSSYQLRINAWLGAITHLYRNQLAAVLRADTPFTFFLFSADLVSVSTSSLADLF